MRTREKEREREREETQCVIISDAETTPPSSPNTESRQPLLSFRKKKPQSTSSIFKAGLGGALVCLSGGLFYSADTPTIAVATMNVSTVLLMAAYMMGSFGLLLLVTCLYKNRSNIYSRFCFASPLPFDAPPSPLTPSEYQYGSLS